MKKFSIALLITMSVNAFGDNEVHRHRFTHVQGTEIVDGHNPGVHGDVIVDLFKVRNALNGLLHGEKKNGTIIKKYNYKDTPVDLTDLISIFDNLEAQGVSYDHEDYKAALKCLHEMIENFITFSESFLSKETPFIQKRVIKIIQNWAHKSGRHNSLLLHWGSADEKELFRKISAAELGQFCIDLKNFLYDLMYSCPKAREQFKSKYITEARYGDKYVAQQAAFDHSFLPQD